MEMARRQHYSEVHDAGGVIALPDCSFEFRQRMEAVRQTEQGSVVHYDTESDAEDHVVQPEQGAVEGFPQSSMVVQASASSRRAPRRLRNCSMSDVLQRRAALEYVEEASRQVQEYFTGSL